jgi:hypothetical protein
MNADEQHPAFWVVFVALDPDVQSLNIEMAVISL